MNQPLVCTALKLPGSWPCRIHRGEMYASTEGVGTQRNCSTSNVDHSKGSGEYSLYRAEVRTEKNYFICNMSKKLSARRHRKRLSFAEFSLHRKRSAT